MWDGLDTIFESHDTTTMRLFRCTRNRIYELRILRYTLETLTLKLEA